MEIHNHDPVQGSNAKYLDVCRAHLVETPALESEMTFLDTVAEALAAHGQRVVVHANAGGPWAAHLRQLAAVGEDVNVLVRAQ